MKVCTRCLVDKSLAEFGVKARNKDGLNDWCKSCNREYYATYRKDNRDKIRTIKKRHYDANKEKSQQYYQENKERIRDSRRERYEPSSGRARRLKEKFKLDQSEYDEILKSQSGGCAICGSTDDLQVDHDHSCCPKQRTCGECIRGILCGPCNRGIGSLRDDVDRLEAAVRYLLEHRERNKLVKTYTR